MPKLYVGAVVVYLKAEYHQFLDELKDLGFTRREIVRFALDQLRVMDRKELVQRLAAARLPPEAREEVVPS